MKLVKKQNKALFLIVMSLVLILASGAGIYWYLRSKSSDNKENNTAMTDNYVKDEDQPIINSESPDNDDKALSPTANPENQQAQVEKPIITRAEQTSSGAVRVSATLSQPSNGTCLLTISKDGAQTVEKSSNIAVGPSYYTCNGFLVPKADFATTGNWNVTVTHRSANGSSVSDTKVIELR